MMSIMDESQKTALVKAIAGSVKKHVAAVFKPLKKQVDELNGFRSFAVEQLENLARQLEVRPEKGDRGKRGPPGKRSSAEEVLTLIMPALDAQVMRFLEGIQLPKNGKDGKSVSIEDIRPIIESLSNEQALVIERRANDFLNNIAERMDRIPIPKDGKRGKDGKDADPEQVAERVIQLLDLKGTEKDINTLCRTLVAAAVEKIPIPEDGKNADDEQVRTAVKAYLEEHPPQPGERGDDGESVTDQQVQHAVKAYLEEHPPQPGERGDDGESVTDQQVQHAVKAYLEEHPPQPGERGDDGESVTAEDIRGMLKEHHASWALDFEKRAQLTMQKFLELMPKPKDGKDAISLEHFTANMAPDGRTLILTLNDGERTIENGVRLDHVLDRGVWKKGDFMKGDGVTWGGSFWIAQVDKPKGKPGQYNKEWRLAVKRGQAGKSA